MSSMTDKERKSGNMEKIPFSQDEMTEPAGVQPGFPGAPDRTLWQAPISPRENVLAAVLNKECLYMPNARDVTSANVSILPDNKARATVMEGGEMFVPNPEGEQDVFGVTWIYDPAINGSMVRPGAPLLDDVENWKDVIKFPDVDSWDWEGAAKRTEEYRSDEQFAYMSTIFTGFFERLISFMDFEEAAIAMIDEDSQPYVIELFERLADLYIDYVEHFKKYLDIDIVEMHDDWGSQQGLLISEDVLRKVVYPSMKRVVDRVHELGMGFQLHSCGKIGKELVPMMIDMGIDVWMGQDINDKAPLVAQYGDKIILQVECPELGMDASEEEVKAAAQQFADDFIIEGKPAMFSIYACTIANPPQFTDEVYRISRQTYAG